ncbi:MAG: molybdate ABC transporter substrate-binding protein [Bauldia sp.]|nr:molybdate ABC transporter substrate-binding protein [Bauldia sp.]
MWGFRLISDRRHWASAIAVALAVASCGAARADDVNVAVAANFTDAANEIGALFAEKTGHKAVFSFGSTGQLYTQINQGAPFAVFLAADQARPAKAVEEGFGVAGSVFTYATGKIVLYSTDPELVKGEDTLKTAGFEKIAIANPETAPYGTAAVEAMKALGVYDALAAKIVQGTNIAQTFQFVETGNAEIGFVALSQVATSEAGSRWIVPDELYSPIAQDAVLLKGGDGNEAATAFIAFLKGPEANAVKEKYGYGTGD